MKRRIIARIDKTSVFDTTQRGKLMQDIEKLFSKYDTRMYISVFSNTTI